MKFAVVCLFAVCAIVFARPDGYTNKYDNIDVDQILHNDRLLKRYTDCLLEKNNVRCPPEATELKKVLSEVLETACEKCSEHQKEVGKKVVKYLTSNKKDIWNELKAKYDPEGKYEQKYEDTAKKEGVQV
ncbi:ejaculatory bulb-specific protein 3-like isoform X2 [Pseudomyrmex gracilis]|nr:ejaculatory bulb-specific protein 3-like isoform X2 [Pseudomyrmex gracilis]